MTKSHLPGEFPSSATGCVGYRLGLEGRMGPVSVELLSSEFLSNRDTPFPFLKPDVFSGGLCHGLFLLV